MEIALQTMSEKMDERTKLIRAAGDRLMSLSGLRYDGDFVSAGEYQQVHVMEFGSGPAVLLMHGAGSGGPAWHRQIAALSEDHRVIVPDIPMFGLSAIPKAVYAPRSQIGDMIIGLMNELDVDVADIGAHSLGALGALGALARAPDRFNRAALIASPGFGRGLNFALRLASIPLSQRFINYGSRRARYFFFDRFEAQKSRHSHEREMWKEMHFHVGNRHNEIETFNDGLRSFAGISGQRDVLSREATANIKSATLLIWGDSDLIIPTRHSQRALDLIPDAQLEILESCGHIVQLEAPQRVTELMVDWFRV